MRFAESQKPPAVSGADLRTSPRKKVLLTAKIVYGDGAYTLDCTIRDLSAGGARIGLGKGQTIPAQVYLLDVPNRVAYEAIVASSRPPEFGLRFEKTHPLGQITDPKLAYLKRIWIDCAR